MNINRRGFLGLSAAGVATLALAACGGDGGSGGEGGGTKVGVAMPTQTSERWIADGNAVKEQLEAAGFEVDLQFANDDIPTQSQQIDQMITQGADVLIIASIDGTALASQLDAAADAGIKVIAYDRLIRDSEHVDFYVTFDNFKVGVAQATALVQGLEERFTAPYNVELFAGSLDDNNAFFFFDGAMSVLEPLIESGDIVVKSGQTTIEQAATLRWQQETAQRRMEDLITANYGSGEVHGVLSPYDGISRGIITALQNNGYSGDTFPIVSGQDAEIASIKLIVDGIQHSTIFKDTRDLAAEAVRAATALLEGKEPEANDTETYENGVKTVPSYLLDVVTVTADNVVEALVDTGYWTQEQVDSGVA